MRLVSVGHRSVAWWHRKQFDMTKNESFKRRVRDRMATTGERYAAARRVLINQTASSKRRRVWVSEPEMNDEAIMRKTNRSWDDWCDIIEEWPGSVNGHNAIATYLHDEFDLDHWWSQGVTVSYERIVGLRVPHQRPDGTFTADKSKTITVDPDELRTMLLDEKGRDDLFGGIPTELRSKPTSKALRIGIGPGVALLSLDAKSSDRTKVVVSHEKLPRLDDVAEWKFFWDEWLTALDGS